MASNVAGRCVHFSILSKHLFTPAAFIWPIPIEVFGHALGVSKPGVAQRAVVGVRSRRCHRARALFPCVSPFARTSFASGLLV